MTARRRFTAEFKARVARQLRREGLGAGRHRVRRLMRLMGLQAIYQAPRTGFIRIC